MYYTSTKHQENLDDCIRTNLERYFTDLYGIEPCSMYHMMLSAFEKPLLEIVLQKTKGNQSRAAKWLGINRNTLSKKLHTYQINPDQI
jgi:Fis family transcriptional regulator